MVILPPRAGLLRAQRLDDAAAGLLGPVGARLDHAAGGQRADGYVGAENEQFVVARRRGELHVGDTAGSARSRSARR